MDALTLLDNASLEYGIIIGATIQRLEIEGKITFTKDMSYDDEFIVIAKYLIKDFHTPAMECYHYFSEFVESQLLLYEEDFKVGNTGEGL